MPFAKGQSGNPGGRPKLDHDVRELAQKHAPEAIERLAFWMLSENAKASVAAAQVLLDRGFGRAPQSIDLSSKDGTMSPQTDEQASMKLHQLLVATVEKQGKA